MVSFSDLLVEENELTFQSYDSLFSSKALNSLRFLKGLLRCVCGIYLVIYGYCYV